MNKNNKITATAITATILLLGLILFVPSLINAQQQPAGRPLPPHLEKILPPQANYTTLPIPTPPTQPGPPPTPERILHRGEIPDNLFQQCLALKNGQVPPADVFSAHSKHIPPGYGKTIPLCAILPQFADQANRAFIH